MLEPFGDMDLGFDQQKLLLAGLSAMISSAWVGAVRSSS